MNNEFRFADFVSVLRRRLRLIVAFGVTGTLLAILIVLFVPARYTATAQIMIEAQGLVGAQASFVEQAPDQAAVLTAVTALSAHDLLQHTLESLQRDPEFRAAITAAEGQAEHPTFGWKHRLVSWLPPSWLTATGAPGPLSERQLKRHLNIFQDHGSHVVSVSVSSISPGEAAAVVNQLTQLYVTLQEEQKRGATDRALAWIGERIPQLASDIERLDAAAQQYRTEHRLVDAKRTAVTDEQLADLNRQLSAAEADLAGRETRLANARKQRLSGSSGVLESLDSPALAELHRREFALLQAEADLRVTFSETHPKVQQIRSQLSRVRQQMNQELDRAIASLNGDVQIAMARVQAIREQLGELKNASTDVRLNTLEREASADRQLYETLLQRREELQQQRESLSPGVHVISLATPPEQPSSPNPLFLVIPAIILSLVSGALLALLKEALDKTVRSERDVFDELGVRCIGLVPQLRRLGGKRPHEYLRHKPFDPYSEAIRSLAASLRMTAAANAPKVVLFSSSVPGEGKTTLAVSFAAYAASLGKRVLLVDFDFRHPRILRELGGKVQSRSADLIQLGGPLSKAIQHDPRLRMDCLPIRRLPVDPLMGLASGHLARHLHLLRQKYDCIVIDSAPLLGITETRLLASMADKVVFAVKWGSTRRDVVQNALSILRSPTAPDEITPDIAGIVITQVDLKKHARYRYGDMGEIVMRYGQYYTGQDVV